MSSLLDCSSSGEFGEGGSSSAGVYSRGSLLQQQHTAEREKKRERKRRKESPLPLVPSLFRALPVSFRCCSRGIAGPGIINTGPVECRSSHSPLSLSLGFYHPIHIYIHSAGSPDQFPYRPPLPLYTRGRDRLPASAAAAKRG